MMLTPTEREAVLSALRNSTSRGWVSYDPTQVPLLIEAVDLADGTPFKMGLPVTHALADVLRWACSVHQAPRYSAQQLNAIHAVRKRLPTPVDAPAPAS